MARIYRANLIQPCRDSGIPPRESTSRAFGIISNLRHLREYSARRLDIVWPTILPLRPSMPEKASILSRMSLKSAFLRSRYHFYQLNAGISIGAKLIWARDGGIFGSQAPK
jgi:hypothetical protein